MRFFLKEKSEIKDNQIIIYDDDLIHQILKVLRKQKGDNVIFLDNFGYEYISILKNANKKMLIFDVCKKEKNQNEASLKVVLFQSLIKKSKMDFVFEKCTEVGVSGFYPVITKRSVKLNLNMQRAKKIVKEASEQSERGFIPKINDVSTLKDAILNIDKQSINIVCLERLKSENIYDFVIKNNFEGKNLNIFIGPEGGFADEDISLLKRLSNLYFVSLGKRILKSETAALVASALFLANR